MKIKIKGKDYPLASTLRVAYVLQGMCNHRPYAEIFDEMGTALLEDQIRLLYAAFIVANKETSIEFDELLDSVLDNMKLEEVTDLIKKVISGITGKDLFEEIDKALEAVGVVEEGNA